MRVNTTRRTRIIRVRCVLFNCLGLFTCPGPVLRQYRCAIEFDRTGSPQRCSPVSRDVCALATVSVNPLRSGSAIQSGGWPEKAQVLCFEVGVSVGNEKKCHRAVGNGCWRPWRWSIRLQRL